MEEFYSMTKEELCDILSCDILRTKWNEINVYKVAKKWLDINDTKDSKTVVDVMKTVRFALIKPENLTKIVQDGVFRDNVECCKMLEEAKTYQTDINMQPLYEGNLNKCRGIKGIMMFPTIIGGEDEDHHDIDYEQFPDYGDPMTFSYGHDTASDIFPNNSCVTAVNVNDFSLCLWS